VVVAAGATVAMGLAVLLSQSRGGAVSLAAGALALASFRHLVRRRTALPGHRFALGLALVALTAGAVLALPPEARARLGTLAGMGHDNSGQFRLGVWSDTARLWGKSPLVGHGFGAYADALPPVKTGLGYVTVEHAESDVLELLAEGGLVGLLLAIAGLAVTAGRVARGLSQQTDRLRRGLGLGAAAGATALLVHSAFDFNLRIPSNALLFGFLVAMALGAGAPESAATRWPLGGLAVALALGFAVVTPAAPTSNLPEEARAFAAKGGRPVTPLRVTQATLALTATLERRPADAEAWLFLAWLRSASGRDDEAKTLARYAAMLDPQRQAIQAEAARIAAGPR
jgi:O-antigen ligase